ncbi:NAD dependent epimerase/dehydratase [Niveomyces insectorum RCEF 264]|uniref:NAD dependent epimerase/dehydratase n=1 Tax=Niveomyces insectorum RCEF 264 TaxID=1081102 RepID=A0A167WGF3_9HYPO|nr:NAD dependent epimerase/dehydratase [Niveomyces insectorum RCEF 264]
MPSSIQYVLVTGATGFIGAHVVDCLLANGLRVRGATRSLAKGEAMLRTRAQYKDNLDFVQIRDFENPGVFSNAVEGVDAVIHVASPFTYDTKDNEKELIIPAINGVQSILEASAAAGTISRVVITSSFASVLDVDRKAPPYFTYTGDDWNPLSYEKAADPATNAVIAYRGSKKFAELAAWKYVEEYKPSFDIVTLCPPMTFGPVAHPIAKAEDLNESNATLWRVASGVRPLPVARVPFWIDVRDLAKAHVEAVLRPEVGGRRYIPASPERFSYGLVANIVATNFDWAKATVVAEEQDIDESHGVDGKTAAEELDLQYTAFQDTVVDLVRQAKEIQTAKLV